MSDMTTPIVDFVRHYAERDMTRFHMPGHKGIPFLGCEPWDLTEIEGADVLYAPDGIIVESENNATELFGTEHTFYSTEGSSLCIKAMLALAMEGKGDRPWILAARNVHKAFVYAAALLDFRVRWLAPQQGEHLCRCTLSAEDVEQALSDGSELPAAVYLTSPDYLGNVADVAAISKVCHAHGIPLLVDNAHGAYLKFLKPSRHPIDLGADLCCDSAHKTLPVLTGGAYLHVAKGGVRYAKQARSMLSLFASTSPSYLILQSLDLCNRYLSDGYEKRLSLCTKQVESVKQQLAELGLPAEQAEPLKVVLCPNSFGYKGERLAECLRANGIEAEFCDEEYLVLMITPENSEKDFERLIFAIKQLERHAPLPKAQNPFKFCFAKESDQIRRAMLSPRETVPVQDAVGRICATPTVSCPPAIPIVISGDRITEEDVALLLRYGMENIDVIL